MKTYFNDAVIGNSRVLACIDKRGELVRLFWPHIDYPQHLDSFQIGIYTPGSSYSTKWLQGDEWERSQRYIPDTNIVETVYLSNDLGFRITCTDFLTIEDNVCIRYFEVENISQEKKSINMLGYSSLTSSIGDMRSTLFDFELDCLVHYRHNYYFAVAANRKVVDYQITNDPYNAAVRSEFYGIDDVGMLGQGVQAWKLGSILPGEKKNITIYICCAHTLKDAALSVSHIKSKNIYALMQETEDFWLDYLKSGKEIITGNRELDELYRRSLLTFKLMSDEQTGGLLAAPEMDEEFTKCGRYAYCWGRDAAFITSALDRAGYPKLVEKFYQWAVDAQANDGSWYQRYHLDGNLAPSWGLQIDETGTLLWGMLQHYNLVKDKSFLEWAWPAIQKGADFLIEFVDKENHLPKPTYDLWEERIGQHTYSCAAVYAGLKAAVEVDGILDKDYVNCSEWEKKAADMRNAIENVLWDPVQNRFYRAVNSTVQGWGFEGHGGKKEIVLNPKGYKKWVSALDIMVDISLLGVSVPFEVMDPQHPKVESTAKAIEYHLTSPEIGGLKRYETDAYMGGNPWILTTLWMALYHIRVENYEKAKEYLEWAAAHKTYLGFLPEQVDKYTGEAAWVVPLTWSHAMFVLVYLELAERGKL